MDNNIQTDVSTESLITAICANMCGLFRHLSKSDPSGQHENNGFTRWYTGLAHPWFNGVLCSRLPLDRDDTIIDESKKYFGNKQVSTFTWWLEPPLKPSDWEAVLSKHGFGFSNDTPGMAVDLNELDASKQTIDGLEIRVVSDEESLRPWAKIFTAGYGLPLDWEGAIFNIWLRLGFDFPLRNYLGYLNGKPVSTSSIFFSGGAAGIYDVATLPAARGKGIGAALTVAPLLEARQMGYRVGVLQSSEMGYNIYKKLGFKHLCQIENFYFTR